MGKRLLEDLLKSNQVSPRHGRIPGSSDGESQQPEGRRDWSCHSKRSAAHKWLQFCNIETKRVLSLWKDKHFNLCAGETGKKKWRFGWSISGTQDSEKRAQMGLWLCFNWAGTVFVERFVLPLTRFTSADLCSAGRGVNVEKKCEKRFRKTAKNARQKNKTKKNKPFGKFCLFLTRMMTWNWWWSHNDNNNIDNSRLHRNLFG